MQSFVYITSGPAAASQLTTEKDNLVVDDVRIPEENELAAINKSILIPVGEVITGDLALPKSQPILIYCAVAGRSFYAAKFLQMRGYQEIYNLGGGIEAWQKAGLTVVKNEKQ